MVDYRCGCTCAASVWSTESRDGAAQICRQNLLFPIEWRFGCESPCGSSCHSRAISFAAGSSFPAGSDPAIVRFPARVLLRFLTPERSSEELGAKCQWLVPIHTM